MFIHKELPLFKDIKNGKYIVASELENLKEEAMLVSLLGESDAGEIQYEGFHDVIEVRTRGKLPIDKEKMLLALSKKIDIYEKRESIYAFVEGKCSIDSLKKECGDNVWTR